jgi:hypothetical protein
MTFTNHPAAHISPQQVDAIREVAMEAEQLKVLHPVQLSIIYAQKWFKLFVPKEYGGLALNLPEALQLEEALAWTDGAVGWTVTLCAGAGWFIGFLNPEIVPGIFNNEKLCIAGSGKYSGIAQKTNEGYLVSGSWDYATGSNAATAFTANCMVEENSMILKNGAGDPLIKSLLFLPTEIFVQKTWNRIGMIATASNSFSVHGITVNKNRSFIIDQESTVLPDPLYQYPFLQFAETTLAVNNSGMAIYFLELCNIMIPHKTATVQLMLKNAVQELDNARDIFYTTVQKSWNAFSKQQEVDIALLQQLSYNSKQLAGISRRVVDELYPYCGMQAADPGTKINQVWRNLHTASQHGLFTR